MVAFSQLASRTSVAKGLPALGKAGKPAAARPQTVALFTKKAPSVKAPAAKAGNGNYSLSRTLNEKKPADIASNFSKGVRFGGFSVENELFVSRIAMLGFAGTIATEAITGQGALAQFDAETGLSLIETEDLLLLQIGIIFVLAAVGFAAPNSLFQPDPEAFLGGAFNKNARGSQAPTGWRESFGLAPEGEPLLGFNKYNELFLGRTAQLGFGITTAIEAVTGKGPLAQMGVETGEPGYVEADLLAVAALFFLATAIIPSAADKKAQN